MSQTRSKTPSAEKTRKRQFRLNRCAMLLGHPNWGKLETAVTGAEIRREAKQGDIEYLKDELKKIVRHMLESLEG